MATMGKYCKAYPIEKLRGFSDWAEKKENFKEGTPNDILYLQENYVVTDGIFKDENIIFDAVTPEWVAYCQEKLEFEIPDFAQPEEATSEA